MSGCARSILCPYEAGHGGPCAKRMRLVDSPAPAPRIYDVPALQVHVLKLRERIVPGCSVPLSDNGEMLSLEIGRLHTALSLRGMMLHHAEVALGCKPAPSITHLFARAK